MTHEQRDERPVRGRAPGGEHRSDRNDRAAGTAPTGRGGRIAGPFPVESTEQERPPYQLLGADGRLHRSQVPGLLGGHRRTKVYGRLDCPAAARAIGRGGYVRYRVFFATEADAIAAGFRPCGACLPTRYRAWRDGRR